MTAQVLLSNQNRGVNAVSNSSLMRNHEAMQPTPMVREAYKLSDTENSILEDNEKRRKSLGGRSSGKN